MTLKDEPHRSAGAQYDIEKSGEITPETLFGHAVLTLDSGSKESDQQTHVILLLSLN